MLKVVSGGVGQTDVNTSGYSCSGGVCAAKTVEFAGVFAGLQRQINLLLRMFNQGFQINEDGLIGKETVKAGGLVLALQNRQVGGGAEWFAENARRITTEFSKVTRVAPDFRPPLQSSGGQTLTQRTPPEDLVITPPSPDQVQELPPAQDAPKKAGLHWGWWVLGGILLVGAGYLGYRYFGKSKGRGVSGAEDHGYGEAIDDFIDI